VPRNQQPGRGVSRTVDELMGEFKREREIPNHFLQQTTSSDEW